MKRLRLVQRTGGRDMLCGKDRRMGREPPFFQNLSHPTPHRNRWPGMATLASVRAFQVALVMGVSLTIPLVGCDRSLELAPGEVFDAGPVLVAKNPVLTHRFRVTNTTDVAIHILGEMHSCTCTSVDFPSKTLLPGDSAFLTMRVQVPDGYARLSPSVMVNTDHPKFREWRYQLLFEAFPPFRVVPETINLGGKATGGQPVRRQGVDPPSIASLEVYGEAGDALPTPHTQGAEPSDDVAVTLDPRPVIYALKGGVQRATYRLEIRLKDGSTLTGTHVQHIRLAMSSGPPALAKVSWSASGPFTVSPGSIHFGLVSNAESRLRRSFSIRSTSNCPFRILSATGGSPAVEVRVSKSAGLPSPAAVEHELELVLSISAECFKDAAIAGVTRIKTDLTTPNEITLPWSAFLRRAEGSMHVAGR